MSRAATRVAVFLVFLGGACLGIVCLGAGTASAETLRLQKVLKSALDSHPDLAAANAKVAKAKGKITETSGGFDPVLQAKGKLVPKSYYERSNASASLSQKTPVQGLRYEAGYRLGRGDFPVYYGDQETLSGGEIFAKASIPLLAGRSVDESRAARSIARQAHREAQRNWQAKTLSVLYDSASAYFSWSAAGQSLRLAKQMENIAKERFDRVSRRVSEGAIPRIEKVDAQRVYLARQTKTAKARAKFAEAQQGLSLYLRDDQLRPTVMPLDSVAEDGAYGTNARATEAELKQWAEEAVARRPDIAALVARKAQVKAKLGLSKNKLLPKLDVGAFVSRDLGTGSDTLQPTVMGLELEFALPLFRREAKGKRAQARSELREIDALLRAQQDKIRASILASAAVLQQLQEQVAFSRERRALSEELAEAERRRYRDGAGDLLRVNIRELDAVGAAQSLIEAELSRNKALAELRKERGLPPAPLE